MPGRIDPVLLAVLQAMAHGDDTHNPIVQASAYRLICLLRGLYTDVSTSILTETMGTNEEQRALVMAAQGSLGTYLHNKIAYLEGKVQACDALPEGPGSQNIAATIRVAETILLMSPSRWDVTKKIDVLKQLLSMSQTHPGAIWDEKHQHWSCNGYFDSRNNRINYVIASLAETLNLVCHALLDVTRYTDIGKSPEESTTLRIESLVVQLYSLQNQQLQKCSAGKQHDLLFLLNSIFLDNPNTVPNANLIVLPTDETRFLLQGMGEYLSRCLNTLPEHEQLQFFHTWILWQPRNEEEISPIRQFLRAKANDVLSPDAAWQLDCMQYLAKKCSEFGIKPCKQRLQEMVHTIDHIEPDHVPFILPIAKELLRATDKSSLKGSAEFKALIEQRNAALRYFKTLPPASWVTHKRAIQDLFSAEQILQILHRHCDVTVWIGEDEWSFHLLAEELHRILKIFYTEYDVTKKLPDSFSDIKTNYLQQEQAIRNKGYVDFIENFFVEMLHVGDQAQLARLRALHANTENPHPLTIKDSVLNLWMTTHHQVANGIGTLSLSPHEVGLILINTLLQPIEQWSDAFHRILQATTSWLLNPTQENVQSHQFIAFRRVFSLSFLYTVRLISVLHQLPSVSAATKTKIKLTDTETLNVETHARLFREIFLDIAPEEQIHLFSAVSSRFADVIQFHEHLYPLFALPTTQLSSQQREYILQTLKPKLVLAVTNGEHLHALLKLPMENLTPRHRDLIFGSIHSYLADYIVTNIKQLKALLLLPADQLSQSHRQTILYAIQKNFPKIILNGENFKDLMAFPDNILSKDLRHLVFNENISRFVDIITTRKELSEILSLPEAQLTKDQRFTLLYTLSKKPSALIQDETLLYQLGDMIDSAEELECIFRLSMEELSTSQRETIFNVIQHRIEEIFYEPNPLHLLFTLSTDQFSSTHRKMVLNTLKGKWASIIQSLEQLELLFKLLFKLSNDQLPSADRLFIFNAIDPVRFVKTNKDLTHFLEIATTHFSSDDLLHRLRDKLPLLITHISDLESLLSLSETQLSHTSREMILACVNAKISEFVFRSPQHLESLFLLNQAQFPAQGRLAFIKVLDEHLESFFEMSDKLGCIWTVIQNHLGDLSWHYWRLQRLFDLPKNKLTDSQRSVILNAIQDILPDIIQSGNQLQQVINTGLSPSQRATILNALKKQIPTLMRYTRQPLIIWDIIKPDLTSIIQNVADLKGFFSLPETILTHMQRNDILDTLTPTLLSVIKNNDELDDLLILPDTLLSKAQREKLNAILKYKQMAPPPQVSALGLYAVPPLPKNDPDELLFQEGGVDSMYALTKTLT